MNITKSLKKKLYFYRCELLWAYGRKNGLIMPFEDELYKRLNKIYFNGIPMSIHIKYLRPKMSPGQCEDRSLFITMGLDNALWVCGDQKDLELNYGKNSAWHYWVEYDGWVYDPTLLLKFKKELYYKIYMSTNIQSRSAEEYKKISWYQEIINTKIEDLRPGGKERCHLSVSIPLIQRIAEMSENKDFRDELDEHLKLIKYDYRQVLDQLNDSTLNLEIRKRT